MLRKRVSYRAYAMPPPPTSRAGSDRLGRKSEPGHNDVAKMIQVESAKCRQGLRWRFRLQCDGSGNVLAAADAAGVPDAGPLARVAAEPGGDEEDAVDLIETDGPGRGCLRP